MWLLALFSSETVEVFLNHASWALNLVPLFCRKCCAVCSENCFDKLLCTLCPHTVQFQRGPEVRFICWFEFGTPERLQTQKCFRWRGKKEQLINKSKLKGLCRLCEMSLSVAGSCYMWQHRNLNRGTHGAQRGGAPCFLFTIQSTAWKLKYQPKYYQNLEFQAFWCEL